MEINDVKIGMHVVPLDGIEINVLFFIVAEHRKKWGCVDEFVLADNLINPKEKTTLTADKFNPYIDTIYRKCGKKFIVMNLDGAHYIVVNNIDKAYESARTLSKESPSKKYIIASYIAECRDEKLEWFGSMY